jgi:hypothetical protein
VPPASKPGDLMRNGHGHVLLLRAPELKGAAQLARPPSRSYGFVVDSVNVSVLLYVPVRNGSLAFTAWLNWSET